MLFISHCLTFLLLFFNKPVDPPVVKSFPTPPANDNSLFYVQRSKNTNSIIYEVNRMPDGTPNPQEPVKIYWIRYASDSAIEDLSYIQSKYAYGLTSRPYGGQKNAYVLQFVSYSKKTLYLLPESNGKYGMFTNINGKLCELKKVFIMISGGSFWFPSIDYVELTGKDPASQMTVVERFVPKK
ncbi:MAG: DUF4833 domain-containing protein [Bacteroidia bacterium]